ncbi:MAG TPA: SLC13 family permease [Arenimonas sp.]|nr:SLC13 family permease [Arenimonas sp.]
MDENRQRQREFDRYAEATRTRPRPPARLWSYRLLGLLVAAVAWWWLGDSPGLGSDARWVAAITVLMALWWMTEAIPLAATALLPIVLIPALTARGLAETSAPYASPIIFLFLGGFLIAIAMEKWNLHRRIALLTLLRVGAQPRRIVLGMMLATGFLSMWVSNTATTLMMLPIGLSVLALVAEGNGGAGAVAAPAGEGRHRRGRVDFIADPQVRRFGTCLLLSIAWAASMGGLGTLLGSPPNAILAGYAAAELGRRIGFLEWMMVGVPLAFSFILIAWWLMTRWLYRFELEEIPGSREMLRGELRRLGRAGQGEKLVLLVFATAAFLWVVPGLLAGLPGLGRGWAWLDALDDTAIAIGAGLSLFLLPGRGRHEMLLTWKDAEEGLPWGVLLLFGGGLSLASAVAGTGLDQWLGQQVAGLGVLPTLLLVAAVVTLVVFLTEVTSNTATAATFIPVLGGIAVGIGADPLLLLLPAAFAATSAFMLPVGTPPNAIVFGTGAVGIAQMARGGFVLNLVAIVLITGLCWLLGGYAFGIRW